MLWALIRTQGGHLDDTEAFKHLLGGPARAMQALTARKYWNIGKYDADRRLNGLEKAMGHGIIITPSLSRTPTPAVLH